MHVPDYMIFIMEDIKMWDVYKKETYDIWTNKVCSLKIEHMQDYCKVFVNYKGYNVIMPMGIWGFEEELQERNIQYEVDGEKGDLKSLNYVVKKDCLKTLCELIYLFLTEHNLDTVLSDTLKY